MNYRWNASPWVDRVEPPTQPLTEHIHVDVAIIGAGYAGLSSALALREQGLEVAVLESRVAGFGASGRNAGHLTPTIGKDPPTLALLFGKRRARELLHVAEVAVAHTEELIARYHIDCHYEPVGNLFAAVHERQFKSIDNAARAAAKYGASGEIMDSATLRARGMPRSFLRGFYEPGGGILNPARYVRGLRRAAIDSGAQLFELTPVERLQPGQPVVLSTPRGRVTARHVVVATNAYTSALGLSKPEIARVTVQLFRTEPLSESDLDAIDWRARSGVYTAHEILESYRLTADQRIVGGSKYVRYGFANKPLPGVDQRGEQMLEQAFRARFPELAHIRVTDHWGGPIGFSLDFLPQVGRTGQGGNILYAVGFCGHGIAQASYAGQMICDLLHDREGPGAALWDRRSVPFPPEPLRWFVAQGLIKLFYGIDRQVDRW